MIKNLIALAIAASFGIAHAADTKPVEPAKTSESAPATANADQAKPAPKKHVKKHAKKAAEPAGTATPASATTK